ncbi:unnamed protein product [Prunus armeniaca]
MQIGEVEEVPEQRTPTTKTDGTALKPVAEQLCFSKPTKEMANHLRPPFITANFGGIPIPKVMVDRGVAINLLPHRLLSKMGRTEKDLIPTRLTVTKFAGGITKTHGILDVDVIVGTKKLKIAFFVVDTMSTTYNALLGRDWIHQSLCVPSTLHQQLALWNEEGYIEIVEADPRPFLPSAMCFEARYYHDDLGPFTFLGVNQNDRPMVSRPRDSLKTEEMKLFMQNPAINMAEFTHESTEEQEEESLQDEVLDFAPVALDNSLPEVEDPLQEINLWTEEDPRPTFISALLKEPLKTSPKDEYPMPMAQMLVVGAAHNQMLYFMDGNAGYNQIMVAEEDIHKTAFMCLGHIGAFEYTVMPFGLRNAGATYQRAMNSVFHDMIGHSLEVYIDDVVIKSPYKGDHVSNLIKAFLRMRQHKLKMNLKKCVFRVQAGNFLGFLVHRRGIEVDKNKAKSIIEALPPRNKKELQSLLGKINFLRRFISNSARKIQPFSSLLRLKQEQTFKWVEQHQQAFEEIKHYLSNPPVLSPPKRGRPLKLYVSASEVSIGSLLVQDNKEGKEHAVYYLSRTLIKVERNYSAIERLCLALYFIAVKLRHYMLPFTIYIIVKTDLILRGRIGKWTLALTKFAFKYVPQKAVKGQAVADFLADHPGEKIENMDSLDIANVDLFTRAHTCLNNPIYLVHLTPWKLYFDGSKTDIASRAGIVLEEPLGIRHCYSFQLDFQCTNNRAEYEALIIGLEMLVELGIQSVKILGDSILVLKQIAEEYKCLSPSLAIYLVAAKNFLTEFREATWEHIPREENFAANELAQVATCIQMPEDYVQRIIKVGKKSLPYVLIRGMAIDVNYAIITEDDWRNPIINYLQYPTLPSEKRVRIMALNYLMWNGDLV